MKKIILCLLVMTFIACKEEKLRRESEKTQQVKEFEKAINKVAETEKAVVFDINSEVFNGWLKLGVTEKVVLTKLSKDYKVEHDEVSQVNGAYQQLWDFKKAGISLLMESETPEGEKRVAAIYISSPSSFKTSKGLGIGSDKLLVYQEYNPYLDNDNITHETIVVGSIYEGMLFSIKNDTVTDIFLGAAAE